MTGNVLAQVIMLGTAPVTTRLFTPENFGVFALLTSMITIIFGVSSLCYERAIVLPREDQGAMNVVALSFSLLVGTTILVGLAVFFFNEAITDFFKNPELRSWLWIVPIGVFLQGLSNILRYWRIRNKGFRTISSARVAEAACSSIAKISAGVFIGAYAGGLIGGFLLGLVISVAVMIFASSLNNPHHRNRRVSWPVIKGVAKTYNKFPLFATWNTFLNLASRNAPVFLLSMFFTPAVVGFYSIGNRVLKQPIFLLSDSIRNAYFQKSADQLAQNSKVYPGLIKITLALALIGLPVFTILAIFGKTLFSLIFGSEWATAGTYVQILSPWFLFLLLAAPANTLYEVIQKQDIKLYLSVFKTVFALLSIVVGYWLFKKPIPSLLMYCFSNTFFEILSITIAFVIVRRLDSPHREQTVAS